jgi:hypothetical protein
MLAGVPARGPPIPLGHCDQPGSSHSGTRMKHLSRFFRYAANQSGTCGAAAAEHARTRRGRVARAHLNWNRRCELDSLALRMPDEERSRQKTC